MKATMTRMAAAFISVALVLPSAAQVDQNVNLGYQYKTVTNGNNPPQSKFDEYHVYTTGGVLDYEMNYANQDYNTNVYVHDMDQSHQNFKLGIEGGKAGLFTYRASWAQIPHELSYDAVTPYQGLGGSANNLTLSPALKSAMISVGAGAPANATMLRALNGIGYTTLQVQSDRSAIDFAYHPFKDTTLTFGASRLHKEGTRALGAFIGGASPVELPAPVNNTANEAYFDLGYAKKDYQLDFRYDVSSFHNAYKYVTFDNPFPLASGANPPGTISLEPDNMAQNFSLSGGADLPAKTHFSGQMGYSLWQQNDALLPFTDNPLAINGLNQTSALPAQNAGGEIDVYTLDYKFTNHYFEKFRTSLGFRGYDYENHSAQIAFPNGWVTRDGAGALSRSEGFGPTNRYEYRKDDGEWKGDYELTKITSLNAGYTWEYKHEDREVPITNEHMITLGTTIRPDRDFFVNVSYLLALRRAKGFDEYNYDSPNTPYYTETPGLVRFDVGDRNRNQGRVQLQYNKDTATYAFSVRETQDRYRPGQQTLNGFPFDNGALYEQYGVVQNDVGAAGFNMTKEVSSKLSIDANYEFDYSRMLLNGTSKGSGTNTSDAFDTSERITQLSNIAGIAFNVKPTKEAKVTASYEFVQTIQHADPLNGAQFGANDSLAGSTSNSLQAALSRKQTVALKGRYQLTKALGLSARYMIQRYELNDYMTNAIPLIPNSSGALYMGASQTGYTAQVIGFGADYKF